MSVGVEVIDGDHRKLVGMLNAVSDAVGGNETRDTLAKVLRALVKYTQIHFAREQSLMEEYDYPDRASHLQEHADLAEKAASVAAKFETGELAALGIEVLAFLRDWLVHHIQGSDAKLGRYLSARL